MKKINRFVIWICFKFTRREIEQIIQGLSDVLTNRNPEVKPKDDFSIRDRSASRGKEKHPNYRDFFVDPMPPFTTNPQKNFYSQVVLEKTPYYFKKNGKLIKPVNPKSSQTKVPDDTICPHCSASS